MPASLLDTKLHFPQLRPNLVPRPRLMKILEKGLQGSLTLISAPAGSGKTTLMGEWCAHSGHKSPTAWLSLDAADNDPLRFLNYLIASVEPASPALTRSVAPLLQSPQPPPPEIIVTSLLEALSALTNDVILAMDDYHVISNITIHEMLNSILEYSSPTFHLVILTRADPPLPLARLRVRGQLTEIRAHDLRFTADEISTFLSQKMRLSLSDEQIASLEARTEGWVAGLQLAALSMQGREDVGNFVAAFTGSHHFVLDYLGEEVLSIQSEKTRDFLLKTSILERMNASLCNALTGESDGQVMLEEMERANLFVVALDDARGWYRYHHLFADVLRNRLMEANPDLLNTLHRRAAEWLESFGFPEEAIQHAFDSMDFEYARLLLLKVWQMFQLNQHGLRQRGYATIEHWLEKFPKEFVQRNPDLGMAYARIMWSHGRTDQMEKFVQDAEEALENQIAAKRIPEDSEDAIGLRVEIYASRAMIKAIQGQLESAIELAQQALGIAPETMRSERGLSYISLYMAYSELGYFDEAADACRHALAISKYGDSPGVVIDSFNGLGSILQIQGHLTEAMQVYRDAVAYANERGWEWLPHFATTHVEISNILYAWNRLAEAEQYLQAALTLAEKYHSKVVHLYGTIFQTRFHRARGHNAKVVEIIESVYNTALDDGVQTILQELGAYFASLHAQMGDLQKASDWLQQKDLTVGERLGATRGIELIIAARIKNIQGKADEALALFSRIEQAARTSGSSIWQVESLVGQIVSYQKKGDPEKALTCLKKALNVMETENYTRVFLDAGKPVLDTLRLARTRNLNPEQINRFLAEASPAAPTQTVSSNAIIDPLSEREKEVLRLIASGAPNKKIAHDLVIAIGTVKRHTVNIFNKLGVENRTEAVAKARELEIL